MKEKQCPTCGGGGWTTGTANSSGASGLVPCSHDTAPEKQCPDSTCLYCHNDDPAHIASHAGPHHLNISGVGKVQPVEELEHAHDDTCKAVIRIRNTTIDEGTKIAQALVTREKARYCAEVLGEMHSVHEGTCGAIQDENLKRCLLLPQLESAIAEQTKIAEGADEGR